jgi:hypothetical protein
MATTDTELKFPDLTPTPEEKGAQEEILRLGGEKVKLAKGYEEGVKKRAGELEAALSKPQAELPAVPEYPKPPSQKIRPFAENTPGEPWQATINKSLMSLGLLAQGVGGLVTKYPQGALAAATGAMQGWAQGDKERGDRAFKEWGAITQEMKDKYEQDREHVKDLWDKHRGDIESLKSALAVDLIKIGASEKVIQAMQENPERALQWLDDRKKLGLEAYRMWNELAAQKAMRDHQEATLAELRRHHLKTEEQSAGASDFSPQALELAAKTYLTTGQLPPMGMGKAATQAREKIMDMAARMLKEQEGGEIPAGGLAGAQAGFRANQAELSKLQTLRGQIGSFEKTATQNLQRALDLSGKVDRTGAPVFNRYLLKAQGRYMGDPDVTNFEAAVRVAINEVAKVTSGSTGGAVTSDTARREVEDTLNTAHTQEQFKQIIEKVLIPDMKSRIKGFDEQITSAQERISPKKTETKAGGATHRWNSATQQAEEIK